MSGDLRVQTALAGGTGPVVDVTVATGARLRLGAFSSRVQAAMVGSAAENEFVGEELAALGERGDMVQREMTAALAAEQGG